jgi:TonB family protein
MRTIVSSQLRRAQLALVLGAALAYSSQAPAQSTGAVSGTVTDSTGIPIVDVEVSAVGSKSLSYTDDRGEFRLDGLPPGQVTLRARRLGFNPTTLGIDVAQGEAGNHRVSLRLSPIALDLQRVVVHAKRVNYTGRLAGYYERLERHSSGYFITRDQIDRDNSRMLSQVLQSVPAVRGQKIKGGGMGVRLRGRSCFPLIWIDGMPMPSADVDLDAFPSSSIQGIELYLGSTTAPLRYTANRDQSSCGTILLWSRGPDTDPVISPVRRGWDLDKMVASLSIFTADQVDRRAQLDSGHQINVTYPAPLYAARVNGTVTAEFVVDTTGRVEDGSFGIVSSTNPLFSEAVRQAVQGATYTPAIRHGMRVRQVVQQPFDFTTHGDGGPGG